MLDSPKPTTSSPVSNPH